MQIRSLDDFIERMETVARTNLESFEEHTRGLKIMRFGNVAVVLAMSELLENGSEGRCCMDQTIVASRLYP